MTGTQEAEITNGTTEMEAAYQARKTLKFDPVSLDELAESEFKAGWKTCAAHLAKEIELLRADVAARNKAIQASWERDDRRRADIYELSTKLEQSVDGSYTHKLEMENQDLKTQIFKLESRSPLVAEARAGRSRAALLTLKVEAIRLYNEDNRLFIKAKHTDPEFVACSRHLQTFAWMIDEINASL